MLFGIPDKKDEVGSGATMRKTALYRKLFGKQEGSFQHMYLITDVCMCEYTSHGHCGVLCGA